MRQQGELVEKILRLETPRSSKFTSQFRLIERYNMIYSYMLEITRWFLLVKIRYNVVRRFTRNRSRSNAANIQIRLCARLRMHMLSRMGGNRGRRLGRPIPRPCSYCFYVALHFPVRYSFIKQPHFILPGSAKVIHKVIAKDFASDAFLAHKPRGGFLQTLGQPLSHVV